jgi:hypothetical protein
VVQFLTENTDRRVPFFEEVYSSYTIGSSAEGSLINQAVHKLKGKKKKKEEENNKETKTELLDS